ncbi:helix-turn-helix transcriptional regulator [Naumannella sp. ID2617S]|nr:helix-turn-helix transcriptional regulator [Naumannella sp. ID2617S]
MLQGAADAGRELGQQLAVQDALAEQQAEGVRDGVRAEEAREAADTEAVRDAFAQLRSLAARCAEPGLAEELNRIAATLTGEGDVTNGSARCGEVRLTTRGLDVLACVAQGMSTHEVADRLGLSAETVKSHLRPAMRRLRAGSRWEAVVAARRVGRLP